MYSRLRTEATWLPFLHNCYVTPLRLMLFMTCNSDYIMLYQNKSGVRLATCPLFLRVRTGATHLRCNLVFFFSLEVSFAILSCSWVLFRCKVACLSLAVLVVCLAWSFSFSFLNLSLLSSTVSVAHWALSLSVSLPVFLFLHWFGSSSRTVLGIHVQQHL